MAKTALANRQFAGLVLPTADGQVVGPFTDAFVAGEDLTSGQIVFLSSTPNWQSADNTVSNSYGKLIGIVNDISNPVSSDPCRVSLPGSMVYTSGYTWTIGAPIYLSTVGNLTQTQPTAANAAIRMIGWATGAHSMYFFPSPDYITHT